MRLTASACANLAGRAMAAWIVIALGLCWSTAARAQAAVCAEVKIEIKQKLSLERQAFDAVMRINNGLQTAAISNIGINLSFQDQAGNAVVATSDPNNTAASFFVRVDTLKGIAAIDGTGSVAPNSTGEVHWLIIPAPGSGGTLPQGKLYFVGASLTYTLLGATTTVAVIPETITVKPQPLLVLDYFLPGDVYSDDPFTAPVEPPVPFTLGVRIKNSGGGTAAKTAIESAQPKIVENTQGLLIGFQIMDSFISDQPANKTLLLNFGDIGPGTSAMGRWIMQTTLSGRFTEFQAAYTHLDSLGGALTSLIQGVATHLLIHDVKVDLPGRDSIRDFLALDGSVIRVYESEGTDTVVTDQSANALLQPLSGVQYNLNFQATTGFAYVKLPDPSAGHGQPGPVVRSDGKTLPAENVWLSKTRNANLSWSYFINFFDVNTTGIYTFSLPNSAANSSISGFVYIDTNNNGLKDGGESGIGVTPVMLSGTEDQGAVVEVTAYAAADGAFSFVQLGAGTYSLKVGAVPNYVDGKLAVGSVGGVALGDTIGSIVLATNANATGYLFAKRPLGGGGFTAAAVTSSNINPSAVGGTVMFKATISGPGATPTGTVTFYDGATPLCTLATVTLGEATCVTNTLPLGARSITAAYSGDASYGAAISPPYLQTVTGGVILTVTKSGTGTGTVTSNPSGINCGADCAEPFASGTPVTLTATPVAGSVFMGWLGACAGNGPCNLTISSATNVSATFALDTLPPTIDVDGNDIYDALTDGLLLVRYLSGLTGTALTGSAIGGTPTRSGPAEIKQYLDDIRPLLDVDGNGTVDPLTDGLLLIRYLFGVRGDALISGAVGTDAKRTTAQEIETYIQSLMP